MSTFFKSEAHKKRFLEAVQPHVEDGNIDQWYGSALYILTSEASVWGRITKYVTNDGILFHEMLMYDYFYDNDEILLQVAASLFGSGHHVDMQELACLDQPNFKVAMQAIRIRRDGLHVNDLVN